ncbi:hypothetical protein Tco_0698602 [Tanacetum coccineum]
MENEHPNRTLEDYSRPSHEGYRNTIELYDGNNSEIDRAADGKLRDKTTEESCEIIENLADHEGWDDLRDFAKMVKAITLPKDPPKTPDRRLLELEDQISYLLKGSRTTPETSSTHVPQAFAKVRKSIFKQRDKINDRMAKMFGLLKELKTSRNPEKVLVREEARHPITKQVNSISLIKIEEEKSIKNNEVVNKNVVEPIKEVDEKEEVEDETNDESVRSVNGLHTGEKVKELVEMPRSQPIGFYLKHKINQELVEGLVGNQRYNDSLLAVQLSKMECKAYDLLPIGPMHSAILKKNITKKEDMGCNFVIPCNVKGLKYMDALVDQGSDMNVMLLSLYNRLIDEELEGTNIRFSLASHRISTH